MEKKKLLLKNAQVYTSEKTIDGCSIVCENGTITEISNSNAPRGSSDLEIDCKGQYVVPGYIDIHLHGGGGRDSREGSAEAIESMAKTYSRYGTTSLLITLTVLSDENLKSSSNAVIQAMDANIDGANILGIHLEGPFLNPKFKGGIFGGGLSVPSLEVLDKCLDYGKGALKMMTLAPELDGCARIISKLLDKGVIVSAGHSGATYEQTLAAIDAGCKHVAHLFNGMTSITARDPGLAGAALYNDECSVEIIADGHHLAIANVLATVKLKPLSKICLMTDACKATGTDMDGFDNPSGFRVEIHDGRTWGPEGKLVGSILTIDKAVKNMLSWSELGLNDVIAMATKNPAKELNLYPRKGDVAVGSDADITVLDKNYDVVLTIVGGRVVYSSMQL